MQPAIGRYITTSLPHSPSRDHDPSNQTSPYQPATPCKTSNLCSRKYPASPTRPCSTSSTRCPVTLCRRLSLKNCKFPNSATPLCFPHQHPLTRYAAIARTATGATTRNSSNGSPKTSPTPNRRPSATKPSAASTSSSTRLYGSERGSVAPATPPSPSGTAADIDTPHSASSSSTTTASTTATAARSRSPPRRSMALAFLPTGDGLLLHQYRFYVFMLRGHWLLGGLRRGEARTCLVHACFGRAASPKVRWPRPRGSGAMAHRTTCCSYLR